MFNPLKIQLKPENVCSDGVVKVWLSSKHLLTEIQLAETLDTVCFLNDRGSLLVGFKNHIFYIDSSKGINFKLYR